MTKLEDILEIEGTFKGLECHDSDLYARLKEHPKRLLRLSSHSGMGLKQALVIAFEILSTESRVLVLDEPLAELHWGFLSSFIYWMRQQDRQYFIATHSSQIMDACWGEGVFVLPDGKSVGCMNDLPGNIVKFANAQNIVCVEGNDEKYLRSWLIFNDAVKSAVFLHDNHWHSHVFRLNQALQSISRLGRKRFFVVHDKDYYKIDPKDWEKKHAKHSIFHFRLSVRHVECFSMDESVNFSRAQD